ncbi:riboflavin synthase [Bacillus sp. FSL W8-0102]|uniref:riboflavin synthase n=1 Tax=Bacillus sp. FSL W8-0102 TaxID=2978205 RepID=UPI0030F545D4
MFTGIVEEIGVVEQVLKGSQSLELLIRAEKIVEDVHLGDSISVNGVCLTVTSFSDTTFSADVMPETFRDTSLRQLVPGSKVNLERAMPANGRFGGHFVSGHVDGVGTIVSIQPVDNALYMTISAPPELSRYFMKKGSVAIDGTSLTIFRTGNGLLTISLIPHTQEETILASKKVGDLVNIECDMLAKYVDHLMSMGLRSSESRISLDFLKENGFAD